MKQLAFDPIIIFSVYQAGAMDITNLENHENMIEILRKKGVEHKEIMEYYEGKANKSILIDAKHLPIASFFATHYGNDSIIMSDENRNTKIYTIDKPISEAVQLGKLMGVSEDIAKGVGHYFHCPMFDSYYICKSEE